MTSPPGMLGAAGVRCFATAVTVLCALSPDAAYAQNDVVAAWRAINPSVRLCLFTDFRTSAGVLARSQIPPSDARVAPMIQACWSKLQERLAGGVARPGLGNRRNLATIPVPPPSYPPSQPPVADDTQRQAAIAAQQEQARIAMQQAEQARRAADAERARLAAEADRARQAADAERSRLAALDAERARKADEDAKAQREARNRELVAKFSQDVAAAILAGDVRKGMPKDAVILARGRPMRVEAVPPDDEMWFYPTGKVGITAGAVSYVGP